jgi:transcriptional regulator with GAF, ATPase, and Fis domain
MSDLVPDITPSFFIEIGIAIFLVVGGFFIAWIKNLLPKKKSNIDWNIHSQIHDFLTETRVLAHADRAQIVQFHNGEYFIDGVSMQKLSLTHESVSNGISSEATSKTGILISHFAPLMEKLSNNEPEYCVVADEKTSFFKNTLEAANVHSYMVLPLFFTNMKSGYMMIQWCADEKEDYVLNNEENIKNDLVRGRDIIQTKLTQQIKGSK